MEKIVLDISMSLDSFIAGPNDRPEQPLGDGGTRLHDWIHGGHCVYGSASFSPGGVDREMLDEALKTTGAIVTGRQTYDLVDGWGGNHPFHGVPVFVLTHAIPAQIPKGGTPFTFVTDGAASAIAQVRVATGDKNVSVLGGTRLAEAKREDSWDCGAY